MNSVDTISRSQRARFAKWTVDLSSTSRPEESTSIEQQTAPTWRADSMKLSLEEARQRRSKASILVPSG